MSKKKKLIPEIRFTEFKNEGEWELKALEDALDYERPDKYIVSDANYQNEGTPVLTANKRFILGYTNEDFGIYKKLPAIIFDDFTVDNKFVDFPFKVKSSAIKILTPKKKDDLRFTYELISQINFNATEHKRYYISEYQKINLPFPSINEQKKIASFLSSLGKLIENNNIKLDALKEHKKGLIQNIFPQEGQKLPNCRFSEFQNDKEWEYLYGDILFEPISNKNHNSDLPILAITQEFGAIPREMINYTVIASKQSIDSYKVVEEGDYIISLRSFQGGIEYSNYKGICSPAYIILRKKEKLDDVFFKFYFKTDLYIKQLNKNLEGIRDGKMISYKQFSEIKLPFPSFEEQQRIASCLIALNDLIIAQTEKIEQLKEYKKGLIQSLFPII